MIRYVLALAVFAALAGVLFVRLAPFDAERFHKASFPAKIGDYGARNSFTAVRAMSTEMDEVIAKIDEVILATPRTKRMAGLPGMDVITYETRSAVMGFPDYTNVSIISPDTVENDAPLIAIRGKARFGLDDLGVNEQRIRGWIDALGPLTVEP